MKFVVEVNLPLGCQISFEELRPSDAGLSICQGLNCWSMAVVLERCFISEPVFDGDD
jgi:hypothetical protein